MATVPIGREPMTDIGDLAESQNGPEIVLTDDLPQRPPAVIQSSKLADCDELTPEGQFPQYGQFCRVLTEDQLDEDEPQPEYWAMTGTLARLLAEELEELEDVEVFSGLRLVIDYVSKTASGEWRYGFDVEPAE